MQVFNGEEMVHQFGATKYRIDQYFPKYKLAIECDKFDHRDRDIGYEVEQQNHIEKLLNCERLLNPGSCEQNPYPDQVLFFKKNFIDQRIL